MKSSGFHLRLRRERDALGLSQDVLSGLCGISQRTWSLYETGKALPNTENLLIIADTLGVSVDYLLARTSDRASHVEKI